MRHPALALVAAGVAACGGPSRSDLGSPDPARRAAAVAALADARKPEGLAPLLAAGLDPHPRVRAAAATGLGSHGGERAVDPLSALLRDPDPEVATAAARALAVLRPRGAPGDARAAAELKKRAKAVPGRARMQRLPWLPGMGVKFYQDRCVLSIPP